MNPLATVGTAQPYSLDQLSHMVRYLFAENTNLRTRVAQLERDQKKQKAQQKDHALDIADLTNRTDYQESYLTRLDDVTDNIYDALEDYKSTSDARLSTIDHDIDYLKKGVTKTSEDVLRIHLRSHGPATTTVLGNYEVLDQILGNLNSEDVFAMFHVSKASRTVIGRSMILRERMFFDVPTQEEVPDDMTLNPWLDPGPPYFSTSWPSHNAVAWYHTQNTLYPLEDGEPNGEAEEFQGLFQVLLGDLIDGNDTGSATLDQPIPSLDCKLANTHFTSPTPPTHRVMLTFKAPAWEKCPMGGTTPLTIEIRASALVSKATYKQLATVSQLLFVQRMWEGGEFKPSQTASDRGKIMRWEMPGKPFSEGDDMEEAASLIIGQPYYEAHLCSYGTCDCGQCKWSEIFEVD